MNNSTYGPREALAAVQGRTLEDWLNSHWDLLCHALSYYQSHLIANNWEDAITIEAIRRVRMEIVVGNRLSDSIAHQNNQLSQQPLLAEQTELTKTSVS